MHCTILGCYKQLEGSPHSSCQSCYRVHICEEHEHQGKLLFSEECRSHRADYAICVMCALEAFQTANFRKYEPGEEHCWCPCCNHDYGLLKDLHGTEEVVEQLKKVQEECICSIEGCVAVENSKGQFWGQSYGWCQACEEFSVCYRGESREHEHEAALLYCEPHYEKGGHEGSSFCKACATKAYKETYPDSTEERCICPLCCYDFGALKDL